jgi:CheY-like chemotaxis protein
MNPNLTIFYADDDREDLDFFSDVARTIGGVTLYTHEKGDDLLHAIDNPPPSPQLIFLDLNMPGKNGFEVLQELRSDERHRNIPVVIFSTSSDSVNVAKSRDLGANFYVPKSSDYNDFKRSIEHTLAINWQTFNPSLKDFLYAA